MYLFAKKQNYGPIVAVLLVESAIGESCFYLSALNV